MKNTVPVALMAILLTGCGNRGSDLLLEAGEQALVGTYKLDNVLLTQGSWSCCPMGTRCLWGWAIPLSRLAGKVCWNPAKWLLYRRIPAL